LQTRSPSLAESLALTVTVAASSFIVYALTAWSSDSGGSSDDVVPRVALNVLWAALSAVLILAVVTFVRHIRTRNIY
jgi:hypothetical protein